VTIDTATSELDRYRLPRSVVPSHYDLVLEPDLDAATFAGTVEVDVEMVEPVDEIVLNALDIEITTARLVGPNGTTLSGSVDYDTDTERAMLNDKLAGFYRSTFTDDDGVEQHHRHHPVRGDRRPPGVPVLGRARLQGRLRGHARGPRGPAAVSNAAEVSDAPPATAAAACASPTP
jgi:hypothetical protein